MKRIIPVMALLLVAGSATAATNRPDGYKTICKVDQGCTVDANTRVAFGASGQFVYKVLSGTFVCNAGTFGADPIPSKQVKECSISKTASTSAPASGSSAPNTGSSAPAVRLGATGADGRIELSWQVTGGDITSVQVMRDTDSNPSGRGRVALLGGGSRSFTDANVDNGRAYWYWIKYTYGNRQVGNSASASAMAGSGSSSGTASNNTSVQLSASGGDGKVDLSWAVTNGDIASVQVMRDTDPNPSGRKRVAFLGGGSRGFTDGNVNNGTQYWYWIKYTYGNRQVGNSQVASATPASASSGNSGSSGNGGSSGGTQGGSQAQLSCAAANKVRGFASIDGGTTGGAGGNSVTVTTGAELASVLYDKKKSKDTTPLTIYVKGTLTPANSDGAKQFDVKDMSNVSIIGVGNSAMLDGIGINIARAYNVIVRNLTIRYNLIGQKDGISIQGDSHHVWIDHNEVYNSLNVDKDYYDELVSGKDEIDNVTVSFNYLHDSWKTSLWGSSDSNAYERRVTFLGNHWANVNSRLPLFRFGQAHVANNYYENVLDTGINARMGARIRIEGNYFENVHNPIVSFYSKNLGYWDTADNIFNNVTWEENASNGIIAGPNVGSTVSYKPAYDYSLVPAADVKAYVLNNAGVGKLDGCL